jgi:enoyl-[acyl-carrier protein] reductase II
MKTNAIQWPRNCRILEIFNIEHPIIQGGMVWISGANLVAAVSNTGCLGLLGAGSLPPDLLKEHIQKVKRKT